MRLAWFSPWPPQRSGVAGRSAELVPLLAAGGHAIDVFVDERQMPSLPRVAAEPPAAGNIRIQGAHDFVWRAGRGQYDLAVYQMGNSRLHEFVWPYLLRWPGLAVLHDARLHHARALALLTGKRADAYRDEFAWNHPDVSIDAAELAVLGFDGTYYYQWPMLRAIVESSRLVATHARGVGDELVEQWPDRPIEYVALGEGRKTRSSPGRRREERERLGLRDDHVAFGVFGALTADKRLPEILRAFATTLARRSHARLILAGTPSTAIDVRDLAQTLGIAAATTIVESPDDDRFDDLIEAVDVGLHLRWPTALETSGPWLRALSAGRATVITDLAHQTHLPTLDPRTWELHAPARAGWSRSDAIAVAVDLRDEEHSLRAALHRLADDTALRGVLGRSARRYWEAEHTVDRMVDDYERVLARAADLPAPAPRLPASLRPDFLAGIAALTPGVTIDWPSRTIER
jgi:glycosyltransferase involved in cell wall biosynthesis